MDGKGRSRKRQAEVVCQLQHKVLEMDEQRINAIDTRLTIVENTGIRLTQELAEMKSEVKEIKTAINKLILVMVAFVATQAPASLSAMLSLIKP